MSARIALFSYPRLVHGGGFEKYLIALANAMRERGHAVDVVTSSRREYRALNVALNVYYRNPLLYDNSRLTSEQLRAQLPGITLHEVAFPLLRRTLARADVIYAKNEVLDLGILRTLGRRRLPPVVCGVHTPMWYPRALTPQAKLHNALYLGRTYRALLGGVAAVHVSNENDERLFPREHGWPASRVHRIPYPYAAPSVPVAAARERSGPLRVLYAGRLTEQKGVDVLLGTIEQANAASPGAYEFTLAGSGEPRWEQQLAELVARSGNVRYLGHVAHEDVAGLYADADVALVPSNWETFPFACLEPQGAGVPVVASDIPGCRDIVADGKTGLLVPPGDASAACAALDRLRLLRGDDEARFAELGRRAAARVEEEFAPQKIMRELESMLLGVARDGGGGARA
jgi:glycosyltransferase involved in cell wall biosynthesis